MTSPGGDNQTYVCALTPTGRGAVAVVAVAGHRAVRAVDGCFLAKNGRPLDQQPLARIVYGHWGSQDGEDLVVCRPAVDLVEVHCHGGAQSVDAVVSQLVAAGCREVSWQQWVTRQQDCPLACEAQLALAEAASTRTALILLDQFYGALRREVESILAAIQAGEIAAANVRLEILLARVSWGLHLTKPWQVVIAGRPNVGKSSLINALVGYRRAIVFDQPGTTRDVVATNTVIDGWPVQLSDTAGLHATTDTLEAAGIQQARAQLARSDLMVWVEDATTRDFTLNTPEVLNQRAPELNLELPTQLLLVINKIDLTGPMTPANPLTTSALTGQGIEQLLTAIVKQLVPAAPAPGAAVPFTIRQINLLKVAREAIKRGDIKSVTDTLDEVLADEAQSVRSLDASISHWR